MPPKKATTKAKATNNAVNNTVVKVVVNGATGASPSQPAAAKKDLRKPPARGTNVGRVYGLKGPRSNGGALLPPYNPAGTALAPAPAGPPQPTVVINNGPSGATVSPSQPYGGGGGATMDWSPPSMRVSSSAGMNTASMASAAGSADPDAYFSARNTNRQRTLDNMRREMEQQLADVDAVREAVGAGDGDLENINMQRARDWIRGEFEQELQQAVPSAPILPPVPDSPFSDRSMAGSVTAAAAPALPPPAQPQQPLALPAPPQQVAVVEGLTVNQPSEADVVEAGNVYSDYLDSTSVRERARLERRLRQMARKAGLNDGGSLKNLVDRYRAAAAGMYA